MNAVLFDLDGTLHDRAATIRRWLAEHLRQFDLPVAYAARFKYVEANIARFRNSAGTSPFPLRRTFFDSRSARFI